MGFNFKKYIDHQVEQARDKQEDLKEDKLRDYVKNMGLAVEDMKIDVEGETVHVSGKADTQEQREKLILAIGHYDGVAHVNDDIKAPGQMTGEFYTVAKGDSFWRIAENVYGDGSKYMNIVEANRPMVKDEKSVIHPGQVLRVPKLSNT